MNFRTCLNSAVPPVVARFTLRLLLVACALGLLSAQAFASQQLYTCGMHPQVIKTEPGDCPICHMKLTPLLGSGGSPAAGSMSAGAATQLATIAIDPGTIQRMNLKTQVVKREAAEREVRTVGVVAFDERTQRDITTRYDGWIEAMFVAASWQRVKEGEPLFEIYSPALYNAQLNYLVALQSEGEQGGALTGAALDRLRLLGASDAFIEQLKQSGKAERTYVYRSPVDGVVVQKFARQGQMILAGQPIYSIASLSPVWVLANVYEKDLPLVKAGQSARVSLSSGRQSPVVLEGEVAEILPQVQDATRAATARIILDNADETLLPGMFTDVRLVADLGAEALLVPDEAVLRSGDTNRVFVALGQGRFEPRQVVLGPRTNDHRYVVTDGLSEGETVVVSGQFMLDSESRLREAIAKMVSAATAESATGAGGATGDTAGGMDAAAAAHLAAGHNHGAAQGSRHATHVEQGATAGGSHVPQELHGTSHAHNGTTHGASHADHGATQGASHVQHGAAHGAHSARGEDHSCCAAGAATAGGAALASGSPGQVGVAGQAVAPEQVAATAQKRDQMRRSPLVVLAFEAADAADALAKDDFAAYNERLPALRAALEAYVAQADAAASDPLVAALANSAFTAPASIGAAREAFAPFSNRLTEVVTQAKLHRSGVIYIFECPMVPKVGTGRWLQRENKDAWNPFFGEAMLHCGGVVE